MEISFRHRMIGLTRFLVSPSKRRLVDQTAVVNFLRNRSVPAGGLRVGQRSIVNARLCYDTSNASISIGARTYVGLSTLVSSQSISIGDDVLISWGVTIVDHDSHSVDFARRKDDVALWYAGQKDWTHVVCKPVVIEDQVWIGFGSTILKGVTVGKGSVVAACSVVTADVPEHSVVAGNPARVIKTLVRSDV